MERLRTTFTTLVGIVGVIGGVMAFAALVPAGCSFIRFEKGPYVVRDLDVVYSNQEEMTFLVWRVRRDADLDRLDFELYRNGEYRPIDLAETAYPSEPYECDSDRYCFQYQVDGDYEVPEAVSPVRSVHDTEGIYAGPDPNVSRTEETFDVEPVAVDDNEQIHPQRYSWFQERNVPLRRDYQWRLIRRSDGDCQSGDSAEWQSMSPSVDVDYGWFEPARCFASRPVAERGRAVEVQKALPPSAETSFERQTYTPERLKPPIVYGVVLDMSIPSAQRCKQVKETLLQLLRSNIQSRGTHRELGVYTPRSKETGESLNGCEQEARRQLPLADMVADARRAKATIAPPEIQVLWVYANNIEVPPKEQVGRQIQRWTSSLGQENDIRFFNWGIGSNTILGLGRWDYQTGWRPIEDDTFEGDVESFSDNFLPFSTMDHSDETEVPIDYPEGTEEPEAFKVCQSTPKPVSGIGIAPGRADHDIDSPHVPWPDSGKPFYRVELPPQDLVPHHEYITHEIEVVVEACTRFCDHRFKTRGGNVYDNWMETPDPRPLEVCQWRE